MQRKPCYCIEDNCDNPVHLPLPRGPVHHWDFVDEDGCLHCTCAVGVIEPTPGSRAMPRYLQAPAMGSGGNFCQTLDAPWF